MKLGVYDIINNPIPQLYEIKNINVNEKDFEYDSKIVSIMNDELKMNKLSSEHIYALGLTYGLYPRGIVQVSVGKCDGCVCNIRDLAIGLLLIGAEQFMVFHNHPGFNCEITQDDINLTGRFRSLSNIIGIEFIRHIMITKDIYKTC